MISNVAFFSFFFLNPKLSRHKYREKSPEMKLNQELEIKSIQRPSLIRQFYLNLKEFTNYFEDL